MIINPEIDWTQVVSRKQFKVSKCEVIYFAEDNGLTFIFISFPECDYVEQTLPFHRGKDAIQFIQNMNIKEARDDFYRIKRQIKDK